MRPDQRGSRRHFTCDIAGSFISEYLEIKSILVPAGLLLIAFIHITIVFGKYMHTNKN